MSTIRNLGFCLAVLGLQACSGDSPAEIARHQMLDSCGLDDGTVEDSADLRACEPDSKKKTTICHVPPGNPANAHTLCIGNPAVPHHLKNHGGDYVGACKNEEPVCTPPGEIDGNGGNGGSAGGGGTGGVAGSGGTAGTGGTGGTGPVLIE